MSHFPQRLRPATSGLMSRRMSVALLLVGVALLQLGCFTPVAKHQYGPSLSEQPAATLEKSQAAGIAAQREERLAAGTDQRGGFGTVPLAAHFLGDVNSAVQEAQSSGIRQRIFVLITDGQCQECERWEKILTSDVILREKQRGWIFVRADVTVNPKVLDRYKLTVDDLPVGLVVSDRGNENYRYVKAPSSVEVMHQWLRDRW
ncbi:MAG: hypothetical protein GEEBNDBF_01367 [bacterium]|nr:hypothetical protein [bacterium]